MTETKTYVLPDGGSASNGMLGLLASLLQKNGIDPNLLIAMNRNGAGINEGGWFMWVLFLFVIFGWGRNGFGNNNGDNGGNCGSSLANLINNDNGRELLMSAIQGNGSAISQLSSTLNCSVGQVQSAINQLSSQICNVGNQVGMSSQQIINSIQSGNSCIASQIAECCCENRLAICNQTNTLQQSINSNATALRDANLANTNAILSKLDTMSNQALLDKIDALREERSTLKTQINMANQTAAIQAYQAQAVAPINTALAGLQKEVDSIKCNIPQTITIPYSPVAAIPNCVAAQYGFYNGMSNNGFWF